MPDGRGLEPRRGASSRPWSSTWASDPLCHGPADQDRAGRSPVRPVFGARGVPRAILAPGTHEQGFSHTRHAFYLADKYQVPVFILTDQFFLERRYNLPDLDLSKVYDQRFIVQTKADYRRYAFTESGVSPRGIPGFGEGRVRVDSDEHDEDGFITEDFSTRTAMVNKRLKKLSGRRKDVIPPSSSVLKATKWYAGVFAPCSAEGLEMLDRDDTAILHYSQVYPLAEVTKGIPGARTRSWSRQRHRPVRPAYPVQGGIAFDGAILSTAVSPSCPRMYAKA